MIRMNPQITVPPEDIGVIDWFQGHFDGIYAILHPFIQVSAEHRHLFKERSVAQPTREQLKALARPVSWQSVLKLTGIPTIQRLNRLLLESEGAISPQHLDEVRTLQAQLEANSLIVPYEGNLPEILLDDFLQSLTDWGYESALVGNEFGDRAIKHPISELLNRESPTLCEDDSMLGSHLTLHTEDFGFLYGSHWDSFYTFLCGPKEIVSEIVTKYGFEGFFFEPGMHVYWHD